MEDNAEAMQAASEDQMFGFGTPRESKLRKSFIASATAVAVLMAGAGYLGGVTPAEADPAQPVEPIYPYETADDLSALTLLRPLAEAGDAKAQFLLGHLSIYSGVLKPDCNAGLTWLLRASQTQNAEAALDIGRLYEEGRCVSPSQTSSLAWFLQAAQYGSAAAASAIGELYLGPEEFGPDEQKAFFWFLKGVRLIDPNACFYIGLMYAEGLGVPRNNLEAFKFLELSFHLSAIFSSERDRAMIARDRVREAITPAEVLSATSDAHWLLMALLQHHKREADQLLRIATSQNALSRR